MLFLHRQLAYICIGSSKLQLVHYLSLQHDLDSMSISPFCNKYEWLLTNATHKLCSIMNKTFTMWATVIRVESNPALEHRIYYVIYHLMKWHSSSYACLPRQWLRFDPQQTQYVFFPDQYSTGIGPALQKLVVDNFLKFLERKDDKKENWQRMYAGPHTSHLLCDYNFSVTVPFHI